MSDQVFDRLAEALGRLANGFPRTSSNVEIQILKKIFSPEEASLASRLSASPVAVDIVAKRVGLSAEETEKMLMVMTKRGLLWSPTQRGKRFFRLAPFIVGIYEAQLESIDHELAHLVEEYLANGGAAGIMKPQPALHRVIPAQRSLKSEWILPYDDVKTILSSAKSFGLRRCVCRVQKKHIGYKCDFPLRTCLFFTLHERPLHKDSVTKEDALAFLDKVEEIGLVHTVSNVMKGIGYVCNCCGCCCGILRGITEWGIEKSVACANYYAVIDADLCLGCKICHTRCQVKAVSEKDGVSVINAKKCIGCGLCVTGCPNEAAKLERKPEGKIVNPPTDFAAWEQERLQKRRQR